MNHVGDLLSAYIDGELTEIEHVMVENHLNHCNECRELADDLSALSGQIYTSYQSIEPPYFLEQKIMSSIVGQPPSVKVPRYLHVAAIILVFFFTVTLSVFAFLGMGVLSSVASVLVGLLHVIPVLIAAVPLLLSGIVGFALTLLLVSVWSLLRLLPAKAAG